MIQLSAKINMFGQENSRLTSATNREVGGETADELYGDLSGVLGTTNTENPYTSVQSCNENGDFEKPNLVTIEGKNIMSVDVAFDTTNNQHPKGIYVSNFTEKKTLSFTLDGEKIGTTGYNYRYHQYIDVGEPLLGVSVVSRTPYFAIASTTNNPTLISSNINVSSNNTIFLYEEWSNAKKVDYVLEIEVLSNENLKEIPISSPIVSVGIGKPSDKIMFLVNNWTKPNSPMVISGIYLPNDVIYYVHNKYLSRVSNKIIDRKDIEMPSYGVISTSGEIAFIDHDYMISEYIKAPDISSNRPIEIYVTNTLTRRSELVGKLYTDTFKYNIDNLMVDVSLKDDLIEWQNISFEGMALRESTTALGMYEYLKSKTPSRFVFRELDEQTKSFMESISCDLPYLESGSLWRAYDKLCQISALHIYKDKNEIVVKHLF